MKPFSCEYRDNFEYYEKFNVNGLDLSGYAHIVYPFTGLCNVFGVTVDDCVAACRELGIKNDEILDIDYYPREKSGYVSVLLKKRCAYRYEQEGHCRIKVYYSAFVVNHQYHCYAGKLAEYFCRKQYPEVFDHPDFQFEQTKQVSTCDLTISEVLEEFGDMKMSETRFLPGQSSNTYQRTKSKFSIYQIHDEKNYEIYLVTSNGQSLYIPFRAIQEKDYSLVEKRHSSYHKDYYKSNPEYLEKTLGALKTPEAALLSSLLSN